MYRKILACALATVVGLIVAGCSTDVDDGGLKENPSPPDPARAKADQKKFMDAMKGQYAGAPGAPKPKMPK
jgi:hypothetical protein